MSALAASGDLSCPVEGCAYVAVDDPSRWRKSPRARLNQHQRAAHGQAGEPMPEAELEAVIHDLESGYPIGEAPMTDETAPEGPGPYSEGVTPPTEEIPPVPDSGGRSAPSEPVRRRGSVAKLRERLRRGKPPGENRGGPETQEVAPKRPRTRGGKRVSAAELIGDFWGWGGRQFQRTGHVPTGRMITWQAPVAGEILDDVVAGTAFDRIAIQKLVAVRGTLDLLMAVGGPPLICWQLEQAITRNAPQPVVDQLEAALKGVIRESLPTMLPAMKRARAKEDRVNRDLVQLFDEEDLEILGVSLGGDGKPVDGMGRRVDVADLFVAMLFDQWHPVVDTTARVEQTEEVPS